MFRLKVVPLYLDAFLHLESVTKNVLGSLRHKQWTFFYQVVGCWSFQLKGLCQNCCQATGNGEFLVWNVLKILTESTYKIRMNAYTKKGQHRAVAYTRVSRTGNSTCSTICSSLLRFSTHCLRSDSVGPNIRPNPLLKDSRKLVSWLLNSTLTLVLAFQKTRRKSVSLSKSSCKALKKRSWIREHLYKGTRFCTTTTILHISFECYDCLMLKSPQEESTNLSISLMADCSKLGLICSGDPGTKKDECIS